MRHFISVKQLTEQEILSVLEIAEEYRENKFHIKQELFVANLFYEPSTRTKMSFIVAQRKLGMEVLDFHTETSSVQKGESLYDTAKTFEAIGTNMLVVRHPDDTWFEELHQNAAVPIINAGAGKEEHPTQCMLDLLTIYQEFGTFKNLKVAIVGDIKHSRVAHSNAIALDRLGANVYLSSAPGFEDEDFDFPYVTIDDAVETCDVVMLLRIQHERHQQDSNSAKEDYLEHYGLTKEREKVMKDHAIILHPAPVNRGIEIDTDLVECSRSRIFKQMNNGVYVRMAIIAKLLLEWGIIDENVIEECQEAGFTKRINSM
ncbi:aspartate carbamoyltransferase catalytic subunit [Virgibacillus sp. C22-A2]|uniref:Aspartate carbamoyltransferase n=1 Tax=Virgibacillus tibetensis TaxID=3042313 RepID=A0ABU6KEA2_9BACI|nr:aspartate carbamoyltransferase catalytic subunit [Virgibacillus sp. C22-A2]